MSRWNKTPNSRFPQTVVPLDNLLREKENKNSVAVGTVMKFGVMQFTSIRSSCYNMGALSSTSPIQNAASSPTSPSGDLNDSKISVETVPKPRKFFKSRNNAPPAEIQQQMAMQQQLAMQQQSHHHQNNVHHHNHSSSDEHTSPQKQPRKKQTSPKKEKVEKPKVEKPPKPEKPKKPPKEKKEKPQKAAAAAVLVASKSGESDGGESSPVKRGARSQIEPTRASGRSRGKVNYNEDQGEEEFLIRTEKRVAPRHLRTQASQDSLPSQTSTPLHSPSDKMLESPIVSQNPSDAASSNQSAAIHPPIVLRISKGTSRLVSTDNEDGVKSPAGNSNSDENKNVVNSTDSAMATTDELIAVLSGDNVSEQQPEQKTERIRIRIKKDYIRSYNDSLREQEEALAKTELEQQQEKVQPQVSPKQSSEPPCEPPQTTTTATVTSSGRMTRRRGKMQETTTPQQRNSPIVSEFDSQSSVLGSTSSRNTISSLATTSSNIIPTNEDCKVIHSRGSSDITSSDMDATSQQSSMAAAPPSSASRVASENTIETGSQDDEHQQQQQPAAAATQKGRRGRKKNNAEVELKPPEPVVVERAATRTRNTRNNKASAAVVESSPSTSNTSIEITPSPEKMPQPAVTTGRSTRNTRNNANNNHVTHEISTSTNASNATVPMPPAQNRFFTRKRKNPEPEEVPPFSPTEYDDQTSALNLSQRSASTSTTTASSENVVAPAQSSGVTEYKHKKLVKRSWEQDKSQPSVAMEVDALPSRSPSKQSNNNHAQKQDSSDSNPGAVKLLISKKKGSIFKSRALDKDEDNNKKRLNLYKHKWEDDDELMDGQNNGTNKPENSNDANNSNAADSFFDGEPSGISRFTRNKKTESQSTKESIADDFEDDQPIFRNVRNVKKAHQIQEIGEFQEMDDDVEYLLDALQPSSQVALRCLSALQLASKCMTPSFRMHIRAHGIVPKFFKALEDAPNDASLGLCTAMVMFALSQDTLKMDLDRGSLELMLNLLECEGSQRQYPKDVVMNKQHMERKQKVRELCEEIQSQGKSIHLNLDNITAAQLAMESLLSLTSKRAGEWLKEDLRELGGIEHIIKTVCECVNQITEYVEEWTEPLLEKLNKTGRCLRIVENVTSNNEENQKYILHYKSQIFVKTLCKFYNLLSGELTLYPTTEKSAKDFAGVTIRETLLTLLKVIVNLSHPFNERAIGSVLFGDYKDIFQISISSLLFGVTYVSSRFQFDFSLLTLVLLSNLTQLNEKNRQSIMQLMVPVDEFSKEKQPALKSLIEYFYKCEDKAKTLKKLTDDLIDNSKQRDAKQEEAVNALIQNSGTHMENTILGSFMSTLLGFIIMNNPNNESIARRYLREGDFKDMVAVLGQYYEFLNLTVSADASSMAQLKTIKNVMDYLRNCDAD